MGQTLRGRDATRPDPHGVHPFIRISDITQEGTFLTKDFIRITPNERMNPDLFLRPGDVLFPNRGTRTTAATYRFEDREAIVGAQFFIVRPDAAAAVPEYLAWFLRSEEAALHFDSLRKGSYVKLIQKSDLESLPISLPPIETQRRIVEFAELAQKERELSNQLTNLRWQYANAQLIRAIRNPNPCKSSPK